MAKNVFLQAFEDGQPIHTRAAAVAAIVEPFVVARAEGFASVQTGDGGADLWGYGDDGGLAVVDATGAEIWDIVVAVAQVTGAAIIPVGEAPIVVDAIRVTDLPDDVRGLARLATTGPELMRALGIGRGIPES